MICCEMLGITYKSKCIVVVVDELSLERHFFGHHRDDNYGCSRV
jgi:hypothetical protein